MRERESVTCENLDNLTSLNELLNMGEIANSCGGLQNQDYYLIFIDDIHKDPFFNAYYD